MLRFCLGLAIVVAAPLTSRPQDDQEIEKNLLTKDEVKKLFLSVKGLDKTPPNVKATGEGHFRDSFNEMLKNKDLYAAVQKGLDLKGKALPFGNYRDYLMQAVMFYALADQGGFVKSIAMSTAPNGFVVPPILNFDPRNPTKLDARSAEHMFVKVPLDSMKAVKIASEPSSATIEIDGVAMKKPTDDVYFLSKLGKRKIKFSLDKYEDHEEKDFDANKSADLKVKLKEK